MAVDVAPSHYKNGAGSQGRTRPKRQQSSNSNASGSRSAPGVKKTSDKSNGHKVSNSHAKVFKVDPKRVPNNGNKIKTQAILQRALQVETTHKLSVLKKKDHPDEYRQCQELLRERLPNLLEKERKILDSLETYILTPVRSPKKVVAFVSLNMQLTCGFTEIVFLCCKEKSRGWGSRLVHHARTLACQQGLDYILLHASLDAIGFFDKVGFTKDISMHDALYSTRVNHFHNSTLMGLRMHPPNNDIENDIKRAISKFPTNRVVVDFQGVERLAKIKCVEQGIATVLWPHQTATTPREEFIRVDSRRIDWERDRIPPARARARERARDNASSSSQDLCIDLDIGNMSMSNPTPGRSLRSASKVTAHTGMKTRSAPRKNSSNSMSTRRGSKR